MIFKKKKTLKSKGRVGAGWGQSEGRVAARVMARGTARVRTKQGLCWNQVGTKYREKAPSRHQASTK